MPEITLEAIKKFREATNAGFSECKVALTEANGDFDKAVDILRTKGSAKFENFSERETKQGLIFVKTNTNSGLMITVACETDFVAKTDAFKQYGEAAVERMSKSLFASTCESMDAVKELEKPYLEQLFSSTKENVKITDARGIINNGKCFSYLHAGGRIGVLIAVTPDIDERLAKDICLHITAYKPLYSVPTDIPTAAIDREKEVMKAQLVGKPENMIEKILLGKLAKWHSDVCLMKQPWIHDEKTTLEKIAPNINVKFIRMEIGK